MGRGRRFETKGIPRFSKPQILLDTSRIVLNAKKDNLFLIAKNKVVLEGRKFFIATDEHNVDFDELVNRVQELAKELHRLTSAQAFYSTPFGPTGPASNLVQVLRIHILCQKFQLLPPNLFPLAPEPRTDSFDFGINSLKGQAITRRLQAGGGGSGGAGNAGAVAQNSPSNQSRQDSISLVNSNNSKNIELDFNPQIDTPSTSINYPGLPKSNLGYIVDSKGNPKPIEGDGLTIPTPISSSLPPPELEEEVLDIKLIDNTIDCKGTIYTFEADRFFGLTGAIKKVEYKLLLLLGDNEDCRGWYILDDNLEDFSLDKDKYKLTSDVLADNDCLSDNIFKRDFSKEDRFLNIKVKKLNTIVNFN